MMRFKNVHLIVITGGPGSGKNTQGEKIARDYGFGFIDMGDYVRKAISGGLAFTDALQDHYLRKSLEKAMNTGHLLPDDVIDTLFQMEVTRVIRGREPHKKHLPIVVCGYPRTLGQGASFMRHWGRLGVIHLFLDGDREMFQKRIIEGEGRGREDDSRTVFEKRWNEFQGKTLPLVNRLCAQQERNFHNCRVRQTERSTIESVGKRIRQILALPRDRNGEASKGHNFVGAMPIKASVMV
ncbi:MAG: nucleoside monophosphate kinase [Patescibacteria group bacterium]